jgi:hypothetical protein
MLNHKSYHGRAGYATTRQNCFATGNKGWPDAVLFLISRELSPVTLVQEFRQEK